uniref:Uncharacterized protein n=1 Tax=Monodelphis domestica TaxID=13616 RepID=A0A5F8HG36_MONDO
MVKGAALFLQQGNSPQGPRSLQQPHKHAGKDFPTPGWLPWASPSVPCLPWRQKENIHPSWLGRQTGPQKPSGPRPPCVDEESVKAQMHRPQVTPRK